MNIINNNPNRLVQYNLKNFNWLTSSFLFLTPVIFFICLYYYLTGPEFNGYLILWSVIFYFYTGMSVTAGYHRLFAHRSYTANPLIKIIYLIGGAMCFASSALDWSTNHRTHHKYVDTDKDPHNAHEGFLHAHFLWLLFNFPMEKYPADLLKDKLVVFQHKYILPISIISNLLVVILFAFIFDSWLGSVTFIFLARMILAHHSMFFINSICHIFGKRPYSNQTAVDNFIIAFLTFGEGYHNFHHTFQSDYRNGLRWFQFDPTKWMIRTLNIFGLATNLKLTSDEVILKAKLETALTRINEKFEKKKFSFNPSFNWTINLNEEFTKLEPLKLKLENAQKKFILLKQEYKEFKSNMKDLNKARLEELKLNYKLAKKEFKFLYKNWMFQLNELNRLSVAV